MAPAYQVRGRDGGKLYGVLDGHLLRLDPVVPAVRTDGESLPISRQRSGIVVDMKVDWILRILIRPARFRKSLQWLVLCAMQDNKLTFGFLSHRTEDSPDASP